MNGEELCEELAKRREVFPGTVYLTPKGIREYENGLVNEELAD